MDVIAKPVIVLGAGGHAKVVIESLRRLTADIIGIVDVDAEAGQNGPFGIEIIGNDDAVLRHTAESVALANGIGSLPGINPRWPAYLRHAKKGYAFVTIVHPDAYVAEDVQLSEGVQVMAGAVIQPGVSIGRQTIINTGACIDHDCMVGDGVHIAPGATLSGEVRIGDGAHVSTGATIIQSITVGADAVVAAGAVVIDNVTEGARVASVPARPMR
jgi:sugar O-acyltransferase (sialic acid O-acetyltransferase NeuD family)